MLGYLRSLGPIALFLLAYGCATGSFEKPEDFDVKPLHERAEFSTTGEIRVSSAVPTHEESLAIFGIDLLEKGIQPVWIEVENGSENGFHFLRTGMDPEYFSPREVAFAFRGSLSDEGAQRLEKHLDALTFHNPVEPASTSSGFVYTYADRGSKFVTVDLLGDGRSDHFTLTPHVPGDAVGEQQIAKIYSIADSMTPVNIPTESQLRDFLEKLPCCASDEHGVQAGPLNIVVIGSTNAAGPALVRRHFRISKAPSVYAFGRKQDLSLKKQRGWVAAQPHVLKLWLTDMLFRGQPVWVGHISTPMGGRFAPKDGVRIDPNVDESRLDLVQDAMYSQFLSKFGFVKGVGKVTEGSPRVTPDGSEYYTDGLRAVLVFQQTPLSLDEVEFFEWERLIDHNDNRRKPE